MNTRDCLLANRRVWLDEVAQPLCPAFECEHEVVLPICGLGPNWDVHCSSVHTSVQSS